MGTAIPVITMYEASASEKEAADVRAIKHFENNLSSVVAKREIDRTTFFSSPFCLRSNLRIARSSNAPTYSACGIARCRYKVHHSNAFDRTAHLNISFEI